MSTRPTITPDEQNVYYRIILLITFVALLYFCYANIRTNIDRKMIDTLRMILLQHYKKELNECYESNGTIPLYSLAGFDIRYLPYTEECISCIWYYTLGLTCNHKCECELTK
jgi:hypothetical protein